MKLNKDYLLHTAGEQTVLVPTGGADFSGVVQGNRTLRAILEQLRAETSEEQIVTALKARFDGEDGAVRRDVRKALEELRKIGALDE